MKYRKEILAITVISILIIASIVYINVKSLNKNSERTNITVRLRWIIQTQFAGYYVALENGYYKEEGLNVKIKQGLYGQNPLKTVRNEIEEFGIQWASDLITDDSNFISLANIVKENGFVLISKKNKGFDSISKFKNLKIATWFIGHEYQLISLLYKYGLNEDKVKIISQKWDMSQFYKDEVDIASAMIYNELLTVSNNGFSKNKLNIFNFKSKGVGFPGQNIFTTKLFYKSNPKICKGFVKASIKGWRYAIDHPEEAVKIVMKYDHEKKLNEHHQYQQMKIMIKLIRAEKFQLGIHRKEDYKFITQIYKKFGIIKKINTLNSYYTNEFIND